MKIATSNLIIDRKQYTRGRLFFNQRLQKRENFFEDEKIAESLIKYAKSHNMQAF